MIPVSKELAEYIRQHCPSAHISPTCREKSKGKRRKRYVEETPQIKRLIEAYSKQLIVIEEYKKN